MDSGFQALDSGFHALDSGFQGLDYGFQGLDSGLWNLDCGFQPLVGMPDSLSCIADSTSKNFPDSGIYELSHLGQVSVATRNVVSMINGALYLREND